MRNSHPWPVFLACAFALVREPALADVTVQEQTTFDLSLIKAHGTSTELTSGDKQRRDSDMHCDGIMSFFCRNMGTGEITRLDKDLTWTLNPKDKDYTEAHFPTPAERAAAEEKVRAILEKLKQCPARRFQRAGHFEVPDVAAENRGPSDR